MRQLLRTAENASLPVQSRVIGARYSMVSPSFVCARVVEQHLIKLRAQHLPGLRHGVAVIAIKEIERLAGAARRGNELHAVLFHERRGSHPLDQSKALQRLVGEG